MGSSRTGLKKALRSLGLVFISVLSAGIAQRAAAQEQLSTAFERASAALAEGRYLEASETLRPLAIDEQGNILNRTAFQLWNQVQVNLTGAAFHPAGRSDQTAQVALTDELASAR